MKKSLLIIPCFLISLIIFIKVQKVPIATESNTFSMVYTVHKIFSPCCKDIQFNLIGDNHINYINRGLEQNIDLDEWNKSFKDQELIFTFIKHTPLVGRKLRTIAKIEFQNQIIYNAIT